MNALCEPLPGSIHARKLNETLHGRSVWRPEDVPGHNVVLGYNSPGTGDALDLFALSGTLVRAMHAGVVEQLRPLGNLGLVMVIRGAAGGKVFRTAYAHITKPLVLRVGSRVRAGQAIGKVSGVLKAPHLHLEVWIDGVSVSGSRPDVLRGKIAWLIHRL